MKIFSREVTSSGLYKIQTNSGCFFIRPEYLKTVSKDDFLFSDEFDDEKESEFLDAGLISACECKAVDYLSRSEQCRSKLSAKLFEKGYKKDHINQALDFLEQKKYLSDERYARSWLNTRKINHAEGRTKLLSELLSRGINKETANKVLDDFFSENDENTIALKAYEKFVRKGKSGEKLISAMLQNGFSYKIATELLKNEGKFKDF